MDIGESIVAIECMSGLGWLEFTTGNMQAAERWHRDAAAMARTAGDHLTLALVLNNPLARVEELLEALRIFEELGDTIGTFAALHNISAAMNDHGDREGSRPFFARAMECYDRAWPDREDSTLLLNLGTHLLEDSMTDQARNAFRRGLVVSRRELYEHKVAYALCGVAMCAGRDGDLILAANLFGAAARLLDSGFDFPEIEKAMVRDEEQRVRSELGKARYDEALQLGGRLSRDDAIALALGRLGPVVPARDSLA